MSNGCLLTAWGLVWGGPLLSSILRLACGRAERGLTTDFDIGRARGIAQKGEK